MVGAATDGAAEDSGRVGGRIVGERDDRHANADDGSGAAVEAQNHVQADEPGDIGEEEEDGRERADGLDWESNNWEFHV